MAESSKIMREVNFHVTRYNPEHDRSLRRFGGHPPQLLNSVTDLAKALPPAVNKLDPKMEAAAVAFGGVWTAASSVGERAIT